MFSEEQIKGKIAELESEGAVLQANHQGLIDRIQQNQNRFQQLKGSIETLKHLLNQPNGEKPT